MLPRAHVITMLAIGLASVVTSAVFHALLPDQVPVHWNIHGEPDRFGSKWELLLVMPAVALALAGLAIVLPVIGPFRRNFEKFRLTYGRLIITILAGFVALHVVILLQARGTAMPMGSSLAVVLGVMLAVMGNWMGKIRRNFYVGIRTPWTIANEVVWERTHRAGAKVMVAWGVLSALAGLTGSHLIAFATLIGGAVAVVIWAIGYSLYWYRRVGEVDEL